MNAITNLSPDLSRRNFLGISGVFVLGACVPGCAPTPQPQLASGTLTPNLFLTLTPDGTVRVLSHRSEMGQGIRTALAQIVADELDADWSRVHVDQADGDKKYGDQNTDGSRSILLNYDRLRSAGATARLMLRQAAAKYWQVPLEEVAAQNHEVIHAKSDRRLGYGDLAGEAALLPVPEQALLKDVNEHRYIGHKAVHVDAADIVRGKGTFGADFTLPNMATAVVVRCPWLGGGVKHIANPPGDVPGLVGIEVLDPSPSAGPVFAPLGGAAVVAEDTYTAMRVARDLQIEWTESPNHAFDSTAFRASLRAALAQPGTLVPGSEKGDVDAVFAAGGTELSRYLRDAIPSSRADGTSRSGGGRHCGQLHGKRATARPAKRPRSDRRLVELSARESDRYANAPRGCFRAQIQAGFRLGSGGTLQAAATPCACAMAARGRHPPRLFPCRERPASPRHHQRPRPSRGVAATHGLSLHHHRIRRRS